LADHDDTARPDEAAETPETADAPEAPETPHPKRRRWIKIGLVAALIALFVIVALPAFSTLQPRYYERYPDLGTRMDNWHTSTHALVGCDECHVEPGFMGHATFAVQSIAPFYQQLIEGPSSTNLLGPPSTEACRRCHTSYREVSSSGDLLIPHEAHVDVLEIECAFCHQDLVHTGSPDGRNTPTMEFCLEACHDGEQASAECLDCHTRKQVPDDHLREDWLAVHADMVETVDCGECHAWSPDYCSECHSERPASHVGNWKKDHQYPALERGSSGCMTCHPETDCKECHD
jgi:hypothetical protein